MKKLTSTLAIVLALSFVTIALAQREPIQIGVKGTAMRSNAAVHGIDLGLDLFQPKAITTTGVSVFADIPLGKGFYVSPEVGYMQKGFRVAEGINLNIFEVPVPIGVEAVTRMNYLDGATNLKYKFGNDKISGYVYGGPYMGYAMNGHVDTRVNSIIDFKVATIDINPSGKLYDRTEFGANAGAGFEVKAGPGSFMTEINYRHSFTDFTDVPVVDAGLKNNAIGFSIGYAIPLGGRKAIGS